MGATDCFCICVDSLKAKVETSQGRAATDRPGGRLGVSTCHAKLGGYQTTGIGVHFQELPGHQGDWAVRKGWGGGMDSVPRFCAN